MGEVVNLEDVRHERIIDTLIENEGKSADVEVNTGGIISGVIEWFCNGVFRVGGVNVHEGNISGVHIYNK